MAHCWSSLNIVWLENETWKKKGDESLQWKQLLKETEFSDDDFLLRQNNKSLSPVWEEGMLCSLHIEARTKSPLFMLFRPTCLIWVLETSTSVQQASFPGENVKEKWMEQRQDHFPQQV